MRHSFSIYHLITGDELSGLAAPLIDNHENGIIALRPEQICDQIHGHILEWALFCMCVKSKEWGFGFQRHWFAFLAFCTFFDIVFNELSKLRLFILALNQVPHVSNAGMSSSGRIVDFI
jgi:hypothetical protein